MEAWIGKALDENNTPHQPEEFKRQRSAFSQHLFAW